MKKEKEYPKENYEHQKKIMERVIKDTEKNIEKLPFYKEVLKLTYEEWVEFSKNGCKLKNEEINSKYYKSFMK